MLRLYRKRFYDFFALFFDKHFAAFSTCKMTGILLKCYRKTDQGRLNQKLPEVLSWVV